MHDVFKVHHVTAYVRISFLLRQANIPSYEYQISSILSPVNGHLCYLCLLAISDIALVNKTVKESLLSVVLKVDLLDHGNSVSSVLRNHSTIFNSSCTGRWEWGSEWGTCVHLFMSMYGQTNTIL